MSVHNLFFSLFLMKKMLILPVFRVVGVSLFTPRPISKSIHGIEPHNSTLKNIQIKTTRQPSLMMININYNDNNNDIFIDSKAVAAYQSSIPNHRLKFLFFHLTMIIIHNSIQDTQLQTIIALNWNIKKFYIFFSPIWYLHSISLSFRIPSVLVDNLFLLWCWLWPIFPIFADWL